ncbi:MAG: hypothetical protein SOR74_01460 [Candidatus Faecivicinus sp.]|nr:hypothetical protein [Candidatus Faecivicinus sp.]
MSFSLNEYLNDLKTLCAIDSGHFNAAGTEAMADFFESRYRAEYRAPALRKQQFRAVSAG